MRKIKYLIIACILLNIVYVQAHPGRTDSNGGHWNRETGEYHFHTGEYKGKNTFNGLSQYEHKYKSFTPPYQPPTDNPYKKQENTVTAIVEQNSKDIVMAVVMFLVFCWLGATSLYDTLTSHNKNTAICIISGFFSVASLIYLLNEDLQTGFIVLGILCTIVILVSVPHILFRTIINYAETLDKKITQYLFNQEEFAKMRMKLLELQVPLPNGFEIGDDDLPRDVNRDDKWGKTFTVYRTKNGTKLHARYNCCAATNANHIYWYRRCEDLLALMCKKCSNNYKIPDMKWYEIYIARKRMELKCNDTVNRMEQLRLEIVNIHKKVNSCISKIIMLFSTKCRNKIIKVNDRYANFIRQEV